MTKPSLTSPCMTKAGPIKSVIIVGGGTAGWMSAAALARTLDTNKVSVTLVESEAIGTVGVGEATIPNITEFNRMLGLNEREVMAKTNATFKLGIEFSDWGREGESYVHPFGEHGADMDGIGFHQYWRRLKSCGEPSPIDAYSIGAIAAKAGKFSLPVNDPRSALSGLNYAYQFDASAYAALLRDYASARGVTRVEGKVVDVSLKPGNGHIDALTLESGQTLSADLYIDCSGFRALLIGKALGVGYEDWKHWLPCDSAVTAASAHTGEALPYTRATAQKAGWQWRIPLQHRVGNGHVYSAAHMSDDEATQILLDNMNAPPTTEPRILRWINGHRKDIWHKNCVAIGLSAGFLEPLESTGIYLIQGGITKLLSLFPNRGFNQGEIDEYNKLARLDIEQVRDFIMLHYIANQRTGQPFWDGLRAMDIPDSLRRKLDLFKHGGRFFRTENELFTKPSWVAVFLGQNIIPAHYDPLVDGIDEAVLRESLASMREGIGRAVNGMPSHSAFIARYCKATPPAV